ncbi:MAG: hypothetical protein AAFR88_01010 [Pseudomonadota bacterium]
MIRASLVITVVLTALTLNACAGGQRRGPPRKVIDQVLSVAPGKAQPSAIVALEVAYARDAREQGLFVAGQNYAASNALIHLEGEPQAFAAMLDALKASDRQRQWKTRTVVMSCDGALAVSQGRFADETGKVGNYVTTWERQPNGEYKWVYDATGYDIPQPPPRKEFEDGDIVVTAIDSIRGFVATCPNGATIPTPPPVRIAVGEEGDAAPKAASQSARDGTMRWRWEDRPDGTRYVRAEYFYEGGWEVGIEESLASLPER